jgi:tetratricopeptide (TPR) repeat protein
MADVERMWDLTALCEERVIWVRAMKWIIISDGLQVRLEDGKPKFSPGQVVSLGQAFDAVEFWLRTNDNAEAEAWRERAADELDLQKRMARILEVHRALEALDRLIGGEPSPESEHLRALAISERETERRIQREFMPGAEAYQLGDYEKALAHLRPLAVEDNPSACFYMGLLYERGAGVPQDYVRAYLSFDLASKGGAPYPADEAKARIAKLMSPEELKRAKRIASAY